jgi:hypothetical protein
VTRGFCSHPDLRDWLPADHLAWFLLDVVDQIDLGPVAQIQAPDRYVEPLEAIIAVIREPE